MEYKFKKDGQEIVAKLEKWAWGVVYKDDTELKQFDNDGLFHQIGEVQQDKVKLAVLYETNGNGRIDIPWEDGMKIIHKYRHLNLDAGTPEQRKYMIYIFGWKLGSQHNYIYVLPDNRIISSPSDNVDLTKFGL